MHRNTTDWYRQIHLKPDSALAASRWNTAKSFSEKLNRDSVLGMIRLFLGLPNGMDFHRRMTDEVLAIDPEFPISDNLQELRLMAGLVMVTTFEPDAPFGPAMALGVKSACFENQKAAPIQQEIAEEANSYLFVEGERKRPRTMPSEQPELVNLKARLKTITASETDEAKIKTASNAFSRSVLAAIEAIAERSTARIEQLAEESDLLWWLLCGRCDSLACQVSTLSAAEYVLPLALDLSSRTSISPPPPSYPALVQKAISGTSDWQDEFPFSDFLKATTSQWRSELPNGYTDCLDLLPVTLAIAKFHESGDVDTTQRLIQSVSDLNLNKSFSPVVVADQYYIELLFLDCLNNL